MSETVLPADERRVPPLWRNLNFQLMWTSVAASGFGDRMIELAALPMLGVIAPGAEAADKLSAIYLWYFLPWTFLTPIGGWLADTLPRKWLLLVCDESRALILLIACLLVPAGIATGAASAGAHHLLKAPHEQVFLILALVGAFACVFSATRNALIPQLVPAPQLNAANGVVLGIGVVASLIGYFGGLIMERHSVRLGLEIACAAFGFSGLFFIFMRPRQRSGVPTERGQNEWRRFLNAVTYIRQHRSVRQLVLLNAMVWSLAMIVAPAIGSLCNVNYHVPSGQWMWSFSKLNMCLGLGMLASALFISWLNLRREAALVMLGGLPLVSIMLVALALNRSYSTGMALAFGVGFFGGVAMISIATATQAICPNYILGRVTGAREVLSNLASVSVNLVIWQLPVLRRALPQLPEADTILLWLLYPLAATVALVGFVGLWVQMRRGPMTPPFTNVVWRLCRLFSLVWHRLRWVGRENVPSSGPVILAANHTTGLDPFLIQTPLPRTVCWVMLKRYQHPLLGFLWKSIRPIALDDEGGNLTELRQILKRLDTGDVVGLFPEGGLQRERRELQPFAPGIGLLAVRSGATIVPVWIDGTPRKRHIIWHFLTPSHSTVIFGKPYRPDPKQEYQQIADDLRRRLLELAGTVPGR